MHYVYLEVSQTIRSRVPSISSICGTNVPGNFRSLERKFPGTFVPGSESSQWELSLRGAKSPWTILSTPEPARGGTIMDMAWFCKCALCVWHIVLYLLTSLILCLYDFMWMQLFDLGLVAFFLFFYFLYSCIFRFLQSSFCCFMVASSIGFVAFLVTVK